MHGYYWGSVPHGFGFPWGFAILGILFTAAVVATIVVLVARKKKHESMPPFEGKRKAFDILAERFARGEIDADTFKLMKDEIEKAFPR
jgi:putative membrane protein